MGNAVQRYVRYDMHVAVHELFYIAAQWTSYTLQSSVYHQWVVETSRTIIRTIQSTITVSLVISYYMVT